MLASPFDVPKGYAPKLLGFYGRRPRTWGEWRSATFYLNELIKGEQ